VNSEPTPADRSRVRALLGREPQGRYDIAARRPDGDPVVIRNAPLLDSGTPMPTRYWLIGPDEVRRIGQLEAAGGVDAAEAAVDPDQLAAAHARYAAERDAELPRGYSGPRPSGGVGGTRVGVKCLHAHWAWHLAGGDDPVGRWIAEQFDAAASSPVHAVPADALLVSVADDECTVTGPDLVWTIGWGPANLTRRWLADSDPPNPAALTNALGTVDDEFDDLERAHPQIETNDTIWFAGDAVQALAMLELGHDRLPDTLILDRNAAEEVFRIVATEKGADRAHNPGLPSHQVATIVATCCIVLSVMRRWNRSQVTLACRVGGVDP
jgi:hypothetical protein